MKIRTGFVSNSSSSSFCVIGLMVRPERIKDRLSQLEKVDAQFFGHTKWFDYCFDLGFPADWDAWVSALEPSEDILVGFSIESRNAMEIDKLAQDLAKALDTDEDLIRVHGWGYYEG